MFSTAGRLNRKGWWLIQLAANTTTVIAYPLSLAFKIIGNGSPLWWLLWSLATGTIGLALLVTNVASIRRLHDRNKSGWWLLLFVALIWLPLITAAISYRADKEIAIVLFGFSFLSLIWYISELGIMAGTVGANNYGEETSTLFAKSAPAYATEDIKITGDKSFAEMQYKRNRERFEKSQSTAQSDSDRSADRNDQKANTASVSEHPQETSAAASHQDSSAWITAASYFPDLKNLYEQLHEIDPKLAEQFKSRRLKLKDFANAQREYWRLLNELAQETCGSGTSDARNFLLAAINNREFETARRLIALGKVIGAENMNNDVLAKFKSSGGDISKLIGTDQQKEWDNAAEYYPDIKPYYEKLRRVSPKRADAYKASLLSTRNFQSASEAFEATVHEIVNDHCRGPNWQPREYLQKAIIRGKSDVAQQFMKFARKIGPENVDNAALSRFKRSINPDLNHNDG